MNLVEEYFLITLFELNPRGIFSRGIQPTRSDIRVILEELRLAGFIHIGGDGKVFAVEDPFTGSQAFDFVLQEIGEAPEPKTMAEWLDFFFEKRQVLVKSILGNMIRKGILYVQQKRYLGVIPYATYGLIQPKDYVWLRMRLRTIALAFEPPDERSMLLLKMIASTRIFPQLFRDDEREVALQTIETYCNHGLNAPTFG